MRFGPGAVVVLLVFMGTAVWGGIYFYRWLQASLAAAKSVDQSELDANPRLARLVRVLSELRSTFIWIGVGLVGWIIFMYFALSRVL